MVPRRSAERSRSSFAMLVSACSFEQSQISFEKTGMQCPHLDKADIEAP